MVALHEFLILIFRLAAGTERAKRASAMLVVVRTMVSVA